MYTKHQFKQDKAQLDSDYYTTKKERLQVRNDNEKVMLKTANINLQTTQERQVQANDRLQFTQGMTLLHQAHYLQQANNLVARTGKLKASTDSILADTKMLFGEAALPQLDKATA